MSLTVLYQYHQDEWYLYSITVITYVSDYCISITKMSDTCTLSQLSPMSLTTVSVSPRWVIPVLYHSYHLCLWLYCISITKMSDTCTLSQLSPMSLTYCISITKMSDTCTLSQVSPMFLTVLYQYHQDEWYLYSITVITYVSDYCISITKMSDTCTLSQLSPMSLTVLYQYHQDEWYLYSITVITYVSDCTVSVSPRWVIPVLYHRYHLCFWLYCIGITKMSDTCTLSQLSPVSDCTVSVSPRWVIPVLYHSYHLFLTLLYQYHQDEL